MINRVILLGNLGKDPEVKRLENNVVAKFPLATHENYKDKTGNWQKITEWHNIVLWGNQADRAEKILHKGSTIFLEGKLKTRKWTDSNGSERYTTEIYANSFKSLDKKDNDNSSPSYENQRSESNIKNNDNHDLIEDLDAEIDDLPF
jgi:single-strand DNA-binding protein